MRFSAFAAAGLLAIPGVSANLHELAVAAGKKYFGVATDNSELKDAAYVKILKDPKMFGAVTPGNGQKWQFTEKTQGVFSYTSGDEIAAFAKTNSMILRCHTLVWHSQLPTWVSSGTWTKEQLTSIIETHVSNVAGHYKGQCYSWDVVNEALNEDGTYRDSVFHKVLGTDFIPIAFKAAAAADDAAKLYYNDYNIELAGGKQKEVLNIIKSIKTAGARIDGVGLQAHLIVGSAGSRTALASVLKSYVDAGVAEVAYTELDIRHKSTPADAAAQQKQATDYVSVVGACLDIPECVGVTIWDYTDKYSWIPSVFPGAGEALPWDKDLKPKPAYTALQSLLAAAGKGGGAAPPPTGAAYPLPTSEPAIGPAPSEPAGSEPVASEPPAAYPVPTSEPAVGPAPSEPAGSEPVASEPPAAYPVPTSEPAVGPAPSEPAESEPVASEPPAAYPVPTSEPAVGPAPSEPAGSEPVASEPPAAYPVPTSEPAVGPAPSKPAASEPPAAAEPTPEKSAPAADAPAVTPKPSKPAVYAPAMTTLVTKVKGKCGSGGGGGGDGNGDDVNEEAAPTSAPAAKPSGSTYSSGPGSVGAAGGRYAQCGGNGFGGSTACAEGLTCKKENAYYSHCQ